MAQQQGVTGVTSVTLACVTSTFLLAYVPVFFKGPVLFARARRDANIEISELNLNPRTALEETIKATSPADAAFLARCQSCHNNCLEGLPWLYAALLFGGLAGVPARTVDAVAMYNAVARALYVLFYITGTSPARSYCRTFCFWSSWVACLYLLITACATAPAKGW